MVLVTTGKDRGKRGEVLRVDKKRGRLMIDGINMVKRHIGSQRGVIQTGIIEGEAPVHVSNVVLVDPNTGRPGRVRWRRLEDGSFERIVRGQRSG